MTYNKNPVHTLQLWFNLPADKKMIGLNIKIFEEIKSQLEKKNNMVD
jgi:redox-sensitive bicupin YhaK (pirin superfamily)